MKLEARQKENLDEVGSKHNISIAQSCHIIVKTLKIQVQLSGQERKLLTNKCTNSYIKCRT